MRAAPVVSILFPHRWPWRRRLATVFAALGFAAGALLPGAASGQDGLESATLKGAGSTFVYPLVARWARDYREQRLGATVAVATPNSGLDDDVGGPALDYEPVGSLAGIQRISWGAVDLAFTEMPLPSAELRRHNLSQWPIVLGGVAVATHVPGLNNQPLRLTGPVLADIFLGRIRQWSDPVIAALNANVTLPAAPIRVLHRADGSGTTFKFTQYLASVSPDWKAQVGFDSSVKWPVGQGHKGNSGLIEAVSATPGAIGYVADAQARAAGLTMAQVRNAAGVFVAPGQDGVLATAANAKWAAEENFNEVLTDAPGEASYPIVATVFALSSDQIQHGRNRRALAFLEWALTEGRGEAERQGYVPLPVPVAEKVRAAMAALRERR